ncbi:MAG: hypothetical protein M3463_02175 [Verrucomicrobiota bacterium]|nr:hypothetical protein [Verrucomicrobiota bacterium]
MKTARDEGDESATREAIYRARRADIQLRMAEDFKGRSDVGVKTQFIRFGDVALISCNIEPFCEIGLAIKRESPFPFTLVSRTVDSPTCLQRKNGRAAVMKSRILLLAGMRRMFFSWK